MNQFIDFRMKGSVAPMCVAFALILFVQMLFAHLKRILTLDRLRLRGSYGAKDEFHLAAAAQNLRKLAKLLPVPVALAA